MELLNHPVLLAGLGFVSGIALHLGLFVHGEWHVQAPSIAVTHFLLFCVFPLVGLGSRSPVISETFWSIVFWSYGYLPGLFTSMLVYRSLFHPLRRAGFRGPWYASTSKLWHVWACRGSKNHRVMAKLHEQYGDFVRTGPSEIAVFHPDVYMTIDGPRSECVKAEWYDLLHPSLALVTSRDKTIHGSRRREWNQGFTTKALVDHEEKVFKFIDQLDDCLESDALHGSVSDMRNLLLWFGFDYMGDFVFSKSFNMLKERQWHHIIVRLQRALSLLGPFSPAPWLVQVGFNLAPRVSVLKDWFDTVAWCQSQMTSRLENPKKGVSPDLTYFLMESDSGNLEDESKFFWLAGDSLLAIVAGSEPTAVALIAVFCELGKHPEHMDQIYEEIKDVNPKDLKTLTALPHLNAVIKEALRMHPALLTGGNRKTTENGITIGGTFIPPHTTIVAPRFSIQRREDCFERAQEFIPERWSTQPSLIRNPSAYAPFGTGHHSCLGRTLANDIMRFVLAKILQKYIFSAADGADSLSAMDSVKDQFTSNPGRLDLRFQMRHRN